MSLNNLIKIMTKAREDRYRRCACAVLSSGLCFRRM